MKALNWILAFALWFSPLAAFAQFDNTANNPLHSILPGVGTTVGIDLESELKHNTVLPVANGGTGGTSGVAPVPAVTNGVVVWDGTKFITDTHLLYTPGFLQGDFTAAFGGITDSTVLALLSHTGGQTANIFKVFDTDGSTVLNRIEAGGAVTTDETLITRGYANSHYSGAPAPAIAQGVAVWDGTKFITDNRFTQFSGGSTILSLGDAFSNNTDFSITGSFTADLGLRNGVGHFRFFDSTNAHPFVLQGGTYPTSGTVSLLLNDPGTATVQQGFVNSAGGTTGQVPVWNAAGAGNGGYFTLQAPSGGSVTHVQVPLSSAQILSLSSSPVTLVNGVANKIIVPLGVYQVYKHGTIDYTNGGQFDLQLHSGGTTIVLGWSGANNWLTPFSKSGQFVLGGTTTYDAVGTGFDLRIKAAQDFTAGDGTAVIDVAYILVDAP